MSNHFIHKNIIQHFIANQRPIGVFGDRLHSGHLPQILDKTRDPTFNLLEHLRDKAVGGSTPSGGGVAVGGSVYLGGTLEEPPEDHKKLYHYTLNLTPQQFEMLREIANQILGAKPSPVWDKLDVEEKLEEDPEEYEKIIDMPNSHAAARMIEGGIGHGKGGGFAKALKHVARIGSRIYKAGRGVLQFATKNKDLITNLIPDEYKGITEGFFETANKIDSAVNPIIDAVIDSVKEGATKEDKEKLKRLAEQSIDQAIETHLPQANEYYKGAKEAYNVYQTGDREKMKQYAIDKGTEAVQRYAPQAAPYVNTANQLYQNYNTGKRPLNAN